MSLYPSYINTLEDPTKNHTTKPNKTTNSLIITLHTMILPIFFFSFLFFSFSSSETNFDFCVGDLSLPTIPSGYACKNPNNVTINDFIYSGLNSPGPTINVFNVALQSAFANQFPGLNGMSISMARVDFGVGGVVPLHTHRVAELLLLTQGSVLAGFIDTNNKAYYKTMNKGDIILFPPTLLHFQVNIGPTPAQAFASYASQNPGIQIVTTSLFQNDLPSYVIQNITLLDPAQVIKLKKLFGGTN